MSGVLSDLEVLGLSRPGTKARRLQDAILQQMAAHEAADTLPTSNRFLFYELEQQGVISKVATGVRRSDQDLTDALTYLREHGRVSWHAIVDETRHLTIWACAPTIRDYVLERLDLARIDPWPSLKPIIITEARTVGGVLQRRVAPEYLVPVAPIIGQCHGFLMTEILPLLRRWCDADHQPHVLYLGDFDLAGNMIEAHTRSVLERELGITLTWERLAITEAQTVPLRARGIKPIEKTDGRFKGGSGKHQAFEAEALGQGVLEGLLRDRLDALLPEPLDHVQAREIQQRRALRQQLKEGASMSVALITIARET